MFNPSLHPFSLDRARRGHVKGMLFSLLLMVFSSWALWLLILVATSGLVLPTQSRCLAAVIPAVVLPFWVVYRLLLRWMKRPMAMSTRGLAVFSGTFLLQGMVVVGLVHWLPVTVPQAATQMHHALTAVWKPEYPGQALLWQWAELKGPMDSTPLARQTPQEIAALVNTAPPGSLFRWRDANGQVHVTNTPPEPGAVHVEVLLPAPSVEPSPQTKPEDAGNATVHEPAAQAFGVN